MGCTLMLKAAKEFMEGCHDRSESCLEEAEGIFGEHGMWIYSISYSCAYLMSRSLLKHIRDDWELEEAVHRLLCGILDAELEFDEELYLRLLDLLSRFAEGEEDEHLVGHARDMIALLETALKLRSGISCSG